jgi:hypothetical protein
MMHSEIRFTETQKFDQWWLRLLLLLVNAFVAYGTYRQVVLDVPFGDHPTSNPLLLCIFFLVLLVTALLLFTRLETLISEDGVYVRFYPFHLQYKSYKWNQIARHAVVVYKPLSDYGGWGLRISGSGTALTTAGNQGLQLELHNGKRLLIGTRNAEAMKAALTKISQ